MLRVTLQRGNAVGGLRRVDGPGRTSRSRPRKAPTHPTPGWGERIPLSAGGHRGDPAPGDLDLAEAIELALDLPRGHPARGRAAEPSLRGPPAAGSSRGEGRLHRDPHAPSPALSRPVANQPRTRPEPAPSRHHRRPDRSRSRFVASGSLTGPTPTSLHHVTIPPGSRPGSTSSRRDSPQDAPRPRFIASRFRPGRAPAPFDHASPDPPARPGAVPSHRERPEAARRARCASSRAAPERVRAPPHHASTTPTTRARPGCTRHPPLRPVRPRTFLKKTPAREVRKRLLHGSEEQRRQRHGAGTHHRTSHPPPAPPPSASQVPVG